MRYVAFEIGRGGPKGSKVSAPALCKDWNEQLISLECSVVIHHGIVERDIPSLDHAVGEILKSLG